MIRALLSYDPGTTKGHAYAQFRSGVLSYVGRRTSMPYLSGGRVDESPEMFDLVLVEKPRWHKKAGSSPAIVDDLIDLGIEVGKIAEHHERQGLTVELVHASAWKGQVPKEIMAQRIYEALSVDERASIPLKRGRKASTRASDHDDNLIDAVGLGLWKLGRLR